MSVRYWPPVILGYARVVFTALLTEIEAALVRAGAQVE
jgi:hypothetical protein